MLPITGTSTIVVAACLVAWGFYSWHRQDLGRDWRSMLPAALLAVAGAAACDWSVALERTPRFAAVDQPLAIAIAMDLSPSMLAVPDPELHGYTQSRFERAVAVLLGFFDVLDEQHRTVYVSLAGFTEESELILGWDRGLTSVREALQQAVAPGLISTTGTSLESASAALVRLFGILPEQRGIKARKMAIVVSDGQHTGSRASLGYAVDNLAGADFSLVILQAGLDGVPEGVPVYDTAGRFREFQAYGGQLYTVPDRASLLALAGPNGTYLNAGDQQSVTGLLRAAGGTSGGTLRADPKLAALAAMFFSVAGMCLLVLR